MQFKNLWYHKHDGSLHVNFENLHVNFENLRVSYLNIVFTIYFTKMTYDSSVNYEWVDSTVYRTTKIPLCILTGLSSLFVRTTNLYFDLWSVAILICKINIKSLT